MPQLTPGQYKLERAEKAAAAREDREYEPAAAGAHRQAVEERRGLRAHIAKDQMQARQAREIERQGRERQARIEAQRDRDDRKPDRGTGR